MIRLVVNPTTDMNFARLAHELAEASGSPEDLERQLRDRYVEARVVRGVTDIVERWYVYRDGHWVHTNGH